jgi:hypothetical protein
LASALYFGVGENGVVALGHLVGALQAHQHATGLGLVQDVGRNDLQHHRATHLLRQRSGLGGRGGHALLRHRNAVGIADQLAFGRGERGALVGAHAVEDLPHGGLVVCHVRLRFGWLHSNS